MYFESLNKEKVLPQVKDLLAETNQKIRTIINDPNSRGSDLVWIGLVSDSFVKDNNQKDVLQ